MRIQLLKGANARAVLYPTAQHCKVRTSIGGVRIQLLKGVNARAVLYTTAQHWKVRTSVGGVRIQLLKGANARAVKCCVLKPPAVPKPRPLTYIA